MTDTFLTAQLSIRHKITDSFSSFADKQCNILYIFLTSYIILADIICWLLFLFLLINYKITIINIFWRIFFFLLIYLGILGILIKSSLLGSWSLCVLLGSTIIGIEIGCLIGVVGVLVWSIYLIVCVAFICTSFYWFLWRLTGKSVSSIFNSFSSWIFESALFFFLVFFVFCWDSIILLISTDWFWIV